MANTKKRLPRHTSSKCGRRPRTNVGRDALLRSICDLKRDYAAAAKASKEPGLRDDEKMDMRSEMNRIEAEIARARGDMHARGMVPPPDKKAEGDPDARIRSLKTELTAAREASKNPQLTDRQKDMFKARMDRIDSDNARIRRIHQGKTKQVPRAKPNKFRVSGKMFMGG